MLSALIDGLLEIKNKATKDFTLVFNHSMTLPTEAFDLSKTPETDVGKEVQRLVTAFGDDLEIAFQPSTYHILGDRKAQAVAKQLNAVLSSPATVTFGSDDPGLYTCPMGTSPKSCYGDPAAYFSDLLGAKERGSYIISRDNAQKAVEQYLESVGNVDGNPPQFFR